MLGVIFIFTHIWRFAQALMMIYSHIIALAIEFNSIKAHYIFMSFNFVKQSIWQNENTLKYVPSSRIIMIVSSGLIFQIDCGPNTMGLRI